MGVNGFMMDSIITIGYTQCIALIQMVDFSLIMRISTGSPGEHWSRPNASLFYPYGIIGVLGGFDNGGHAQSAICETNAWHYERLSDFVIIYDPLHHTTMIKFTFYNKGVQNEKGS